MVITTQDFWKDYTIPSINISSTSTKVCAYNAVSKNEYGPNDISSLVSDIAAGDLSALRISSLSESVNSDDSPTSIQLVAPPNNFPVNTISSKYEVTSNSFNNCVLNKDSSDTSNFGKALCWSRNHTTKAAGSWNFDWSSPTLSDVKTFGKGSNGANTYCYIDTSENFRCSGSSYYGGWSNIGDYHAASAFGIDPLNGEKIL